MAEIFEIINGTDFLNPALVRELAKIVVVAEIRDPDRLKYLSDLEAAVVVPGSGYQTLVLGQSKQELC